MLDPGLFVVHPVGTGFKPVKLSVRDGSLRTFLSQCPLECVISLGNQPRPNNVRSKLVLNGTLVTGQRYASFKWLSIRQTCDLGAF